MSNVSGMKQDPVIDGGQRCTPAMLPPHYLVAALVLIAGCHWLPGPTLWFGLPDGAWFAIAGSLASIGVAIAMRGSRQFARAQTNIVPFTPASTLVTNGVFRWTRNPMYLGMVLALGGATVASNSMAALLVTIGFGWVIHSRFIIHEEAQMEATFPERYAAYRAKTRRWL